MSNQRSTASRRRRSRAAVERQGLKLQLLEGTFCVCRLDPQERVPVWALRRGGFVSISRSDDELSIICDEKRVPNDVERESGWRALRVAGPLDFSLVGVVASIAQPLARARISLLSVATYDTDYVLVRERKLEAALAALAEQGHELEIPEDVAEEIAEEIAEKADEEDEAQTEEPVEELAEDGEGGEGGEEEASAEDAEDDVDEEEPEDEDERPRRRSGRRRSGRRRSGRRRGEEEPEKDEADTEAPEEEEAEKPEPPARQKRHRGGRKGGEEEGASSEGLFTGAIPQNPVEITDRTFDDLGLSDEMVRTVRELGYEHPTPIQASAIPHALEGRDVVGLAQTGSGKTAAFVLPMAEHLNHGRGVRGVILCPTREIALQTKAFLDLVGKNHDLETVCVIGGVKMGPQIDGLRRHPDIIVATPGRLFDHLERGNVKLDKIEKVVLDEADHMLDLGFLPQIQRILQRVPDERQTMMFSATMPPPIERLMQLFMNDPERVDFRPENRVAEGIEHRLYLVRNQDKRQALLELVQQVPGSTLVFTRRRLDAEWVSSMLENAGHAVERIHSDLSQNQRVRALKGFREEQHRILVATDVAARGIDIPVIRHVINFDLPDNVEDYVHRAGRTARGSSAGLVSSVGTWLDKPIVRELEDVLGEKIPRCELPGVEAYAELQRKPKIRRRLL